MNNNTDQRCTDLIKLSEGCRLTPYRCPAGVLTVGYGHTGHDVLEGQPITQGQADTLLLLDVKEATEALNKLVTVTLTAGQAGACVDFIFNLGRGAFGGSTLCKLINKSRFEDASKEFARWVYGGGQALPGLVKRREAERELFLS